MVEYPAARLAEVRYGATRICPRHTHERPFYSVLLNGAYTESYACTTLSHRRLHAVFHTEDTLHRDRVEAANTSFFLVEVDPALAELSPARRRGAEPAMVNESTTWLARRLYQHFREGTLDSLLLEGTLLEMLWTRPDEAIAAPSDRPRWLGKVMDILHAEFRGPISLERIATRIGIHPAYLSRRFRAVYGFSLGDYANRLRIRYAQLRLAQPEVTLSEIAHDCGFADQPHFTRVFRAQLGSTPGAFRTRYSACK
jgi:AraC family transcriptional regulator